ncbi:MAG TPA: DinB family protein [Myxococcales bacterium]
MEVFETLSRTPALLARVAAQVPDALVRVRSGLFALVEHAWHIADLEREGFGERVRRLIAEEDLFLPDFDGERLAREREYLMADLAPAIAAFAGAREQTLRSLRAVSGGQWTRSGRQEGVGTVTLAVMPQRILDHDFAHLNEIADLLADLLPSHPMIDELRAIAQGGPKTSKAA